MRFSFSRRTDHNGINLGRLFAVVLLSGVFATSPLHSPPGDSLGAAGQDGAGHKLGRRSPDGPPAPPPSGAGQDPSKPPIAFGGPSPPPYQGTGPPPFWGAAKMAQVPAQPNDSPPPQPTGSSPAQPQAAQAGQPHLEPGQSGAQPPPHPGAGGAAGDWRLFLSAQF